MRLFTRAPQPTSTAPQDRGDTAPNAAPDAAQDAAPPLPPGMRLVRCYHCRRDVTLAKAARTATCPACYKPLVLDDLSIREGGVSGKLATCGKITVEKKGRAVTRTVEAGRGVEVQGSLDAKVSSAGPVVLGSKATLKGEVEAPSLIVKAGCRIDGAFFRIGPK